MSAAGVVLAFGVSVTLGAVAALWLYHDVSQKEEQRQREWTATVFDHHKCRSCGAMYPRTLGYHRYHASHGLRLPSDCPSCVGGVGREESHGASREDH
jgi:hypothetical protein